MVSVESCILPCLLNLHVVADILQKVSCGVQLFFWTNNIHEDMTISISKRRTLHFLYKRSNYISKEILIWTFYFQKTCLCKVGGLLNHLENCLRLPLGLFLHHVQFEISFVSFTSAYKEVSSRPLFCSYSCSKSLTDGCRTESKCGIPWGAVL